MPKYIPFTDAQKEQAASVDLEEFLRRRGEKLIASGRDKRLASDHSITIRGCEWFDHAAEQGGKAIGLPSSSSTGLDSHFLLRLTCVMTSLTVPRRASSLHRFDQRICFSTTGI